VRNCQSIPGQDLFQYVDEDGKPQNIGSGDVNAYLREISGGDYTAKDFRTWRGTVLAASALRKSRHFDSVAQGKKNIVQAVKETAQSLGNTPSVCRKAYIHPAILEAYRNGSIGSAFRRRNRTRTNHSLPPDEASVLGLLQ